VNLVLISADPDSDEFSLIPGKKVQLVISVYTNHDTPDWKNKAITEAEKVTEAGVEQLRKEHHSWWNHFLFSNERLTHITLSLPPAVIEVLPSAAHKHHLLRVTKRHGEVIII